MAVAVSPHVTVGVGEADSVAFWLEVSVVEDDGEVLGEDDGLREGVSLPLGLREPLREIDWLGERPCERLPEREGESDADGVAVELEDRDSEVEADADAVDETDGESDALPVILGLADGAVLRVPDMLADEDADWEAIGATERDPDALGVCDSDAVAVRDAVPDTDELPDELDVDEEVRVGSAELVAD